VLGIANIIEICGVCAGCEEDDAGYIDTSDWQPDPYDVVASARRYVIAKRFSDSAMLDAIFGLTDMGDPYDVVASARRYVIAKRFSDSAMLDAIFGLTDMGTDNEIIGEFQSWCKGFRIV
jgi:hypothetical protein